MDLVTGRPEPAAGEAYERFVRLLVQHEAAVRAFVRPLVGTWNDLDDVIQQTCLVLWRKFDEFEPGTDFRAWACTIARFEVLKHHRAKARDRHVFSEELLGLLAEEGAAELARRERERRALEGCLQRLPERHMELVRCCYAGDRTIREVAEAVGRTAKSVYRVLDRVRVSLLECIERSLAEEAVP
jgi:RNA polymerase sigma-70 factor (ECF subfamily)